MKFAKELEREAVPEWRIKYLNYKAGKKHVKAVARAINRATATSRITHRRTCTLPSLGQQLWPAKGDSDIDARNSDDASDQLLPKTQAIDIAARSEGKGLTSNGESLQYGSFVPTPPSSWPKKSGGGLQGEACLSSSLVEPPETSEQSSASKSRGPGRRSLANRFASHRSYSCADVPKTFRRSSLARQSFDLVRKHEQDFYAFMDSELEKVETFYKQKEQQAGKRLDLLREQLHEMRDRRIREMAADERIEENLAHSDAGDDALDKSIGWVQPWKAKVFPPGPNSKALKNMPPPIPPAASPGASSEARMEYVRAQRHEISYRTAKRKLKRAVLEFYRSLELLKSYALLNRTAFRKLNKKFDKTVHVQQPPLRFVTENVNKSYFVTSPVLEVHMKTVEDLYSRYFEHGNQKLAVGKLRRLTKKPKDESGSAFLNGILLGTGAVFLSQGIVCAAKLLSDDDDPTLRLHTNYLLQIYGGYLLMLLLFFLFCINCFIWKKNNVNYPFIFEFDQRTQLDWRHLAEFPSFCLLLLGLTTWANFSRYGGDDVFLYYPVILIAVTVLMVFLPAPILAYRSRKWFVFSHGRLLLAGLYPVEFRDFFLGDMYCSLTYAMANVELFFCLYARHWQDPPMCNSSHSQLLGFLTTLPPIWRFLQCIRRYRDTGNIFPHLVNCGKYSMSILANVCLSLYRVRGSDSNLALFITFSIINGIYCAIWDLFMDFSLLQPQSRHYYLRDILAFKGRWIYYLIMTIDPVLRFSWIFYVFYTYDAQHSTMISFMVGFMEVFRRGMWALLRVENEHCGNVLQSKASREVPLPYRIEPLLDPAIEAIAPEVLAEEERERRESQEGGGRLRQVFSTPPSLGSLESQPVRLHRRAKTTLHSRMGSRGFSQVLAEAHMQDFERKRRLDEEIQEGMVVQDQSDDDDDDDDSFMDVRTPRPESRTGHAT